MTSFSVLIASIWLLSSILLVLHRISPQIGFTPLLMTVGGLIVIVESQWGVYIEPLPEFYMFITSNIIVPLVLMIVLVMYISCGAPPARLMIYSVLGIALLTLMWLYAYQLYLSLPGAGSLAGFTSEDFTINPRITLASLVAFGADMFVIVVFYQGVRNTFQQIPEWMVVGLALLATLWTDAILFRLISDLGTPDFIAFLPGDILGKTIAGLILAPPVTLYLAGIAPHMSNYLGSANRPTFDVFQGSLAELKLALVRTTAALQQSEGMREKERLQLELEQQKLNFMQDFLNDISHDLKSPLTSINLKIHMLERLDDKEKRRVSAEEARQLTMRMNQMIDDLLMLARLENTATLHLEQVDINQLIKEAITPFKALAAQKNITLTVNLELHPVLCRGVRGDLRRVFENLIGNAVNYTPSDGQVILETSSSEKEVIIRVMDTGIGIPATDLAHIYNRFYRSQNAQQFSPTGTGLGLAIVQKALRQHHGRIEVFSEVNRGTSFTIYLPKNAVKSLA